ncbi:MAG TPA: hypothetical protein VIC56_02075 [Gemmatimonadota bacterium]
MTMREDRRLPWIALAVLVAALAISFFVASARFAFLNFFYLPVLLVAYWSGRRMAVLLATFSALFILFLAIVQPTAFGSLDDGLAGETPLNLLVWGCFLVLVGYTSGTFAEQLRRRSVRPEKPEMTLYNIGTLAIIKGYLRHEQVLKILQIQQKNGKLFGEIAVGLRLLTPAQVDELLHLQEEKRAVTSSEIAMAKLELAKAQKDGAAASRRS